MNAELGSSTVMGESVLIRAVRLCFADGSTGFSLGAARTPLGQGRARVSESQPAGATPMRTIAVQG